MKHFFTKNKDFQWFSKWKIASLFIFLIFIGMQGAKAQYTAIPDANFEQALFDLGIDTVNFDHRVLTSNVSGVTSLDVSNTAIVSLTGIGAFSSLTDLNCSSNLLTNLNVSGLQSLTFLYCSGNRLTSLSVSGLSNLNTLNCTFNSYYNSDTGIFTSLTSINLAGLSNLGSLDCSHNAISSLNVSGLQSLYNLNCSGNRLTSLNVSGLSNLSTLNCSYNYWSDNGTITYLTDINVAGLSNLNTLDCSQNVMLSSLNLTGLSNLSDLKLSGNNFSTINLSGLSNLSWLDISSNNLSALNIAGTGIYSLNCSNNLLTTLVTTGASNLNYLYCDDNNITTLDLSSLTSLSSFTSTHNYSLSCISVADVAAALSAGWSVDSWSTFKLLSSPCIYTAIPDANFEQALIDLGHDTIIDGKVLTSSVTGITTLDVSNKSISYLNGIKSFTALQHLNCSINSLYALDIVGLSNLKTIDCSSNSIAEFLETNTTNLTSLNCSFNPLGSLNLSGLTNLNTLNCSSNSLTDLDFTGLTHLTTLECSYNSLPTISYSSLTTLTSLDCSYTERTSLSLTGLTNLVSLKFSDNLLTTINLSGLSNLKTLDCSNNKLSTISLSGLSLLETFSCGGNLLTSLSLSNMPTLKNLYCIGGYNSSYDGNVFSSTVTSVLTSLTLTGLSNLEDLDCRINKLTTMSLSGLTSLKSLRCGNNNFSTLSLNASNFPSLIDLDCSGLLIGPKGNISSLDLVGFSNLKTLDCSKNLLSSLNLTGLTSLTSLTCGRNSFTSLNVNSTTFPALHFLNCNGWINNQGLINSLNLTGLSNAVSVDCTGNPNLTCIAVSDPIVAASNTNWSKDAVANYSTNCSLIIPTSKVKANLCGATLSSLSANINADYVAGYQQYRFEVTNGATVNTVVVNKYNFSLTQTPGIAYGTTYGVRVAVKMGGTWGQYGVSCNVTTPLLTANAVPTTTIMSSFCGTTLAALDTKIGATPVTNATGYRFEITTAGVTTVYDSTVYNFRLAQAGIATYGTTYSIRVGALVNGVYGNYGTACNVTTPVLNVNSIPVTKLLPAFCDATLAAKDTKIGTMPVSAASGYRFEIISGGVTTVYDSPTYNFKLAQAGVIVANSTTYAIRVAAKVNDIYGNYGASCNVTTPAAAASVRLKAKSFEVAAYPNPFETAFNLNLETPSKEDVTIAVYDMMGKLVETHQVNPMEVTNLAIGSNFAAGIYNVIVSQANEMQAIRLIRK